MSEPRPLRIGLTGGIASGKTTVAAIFDRCGARLIDTDVLARRVVEPGQPALDEIIATFGHELLRDDGTLDRRRLRGLVFADATRRRALENILHPRIRDAALVEAERGGGPYQVIVVPLLVDSPMKAMMDRILVVDCSEETQLARLLERDAESIDQAKRMIAAQSSRADRLAIADDVITNDGSREETERQVEYLHRRYLEMAEAGDAASRS